MRLRRSQARRLIAAGLISLILLVLIADQSGYFPGLTLSSTWRLILITFVTLLLFVLFLAIRYLIFKPIRGIMERLEDPDEMQRDFIRRKFLPFEIRMLYKKILDIAQIQQEELDRYHTDGVLFSSILQSMSDGIMIVDEAGTISLLNQAAAKMFGINKEHVIGQTLAEGLRNYRLNDLLLKCVSSGQQESTSLENPLEKSYVYCIATPLDPHLPGKILFLFQNLTRIRQLEIIRRDFISNVSHELRTPLASLKLITETLQSGAINDPAAAKNFLNHMEGEVDNLTQMVEELLELSKIESGKVPLDKQWTKPTDVLRESVERMSLQAERAGIDIQCHCEPELPEIFADSTRLEQVLVNLLHNAIKFTPPGGQVLASAYQDGQDIVFSVKDSGVGIPAKDLERIFERFYKADPSRSKRGTGLGLSISRHIVEAHNGTIWAESQPRQGSTFFFRIPIK